MVTVSYSRRRIRRQLRRANLRSIRLVRRHHMSLVSAGVLAVALVLTLGGSMPAFPRETPPVKATGDEPPRDAPKASPPPVAVASLPDAPKAPRLLIYYFVSSEQRRDEIEMAVMADAATHRAALHGPATQRYYLVIRTASDEAEAVALLNELYVSAPARGYHLSVVDIR